ncbi:MULTISPECIES: formyltetrahydrofolate deformylase [Sphingobacterium]|uniref:Formyltetrahydrofolate deformylase n=1 Tax=Sphingobacterium litopenaei TaxID=2763500 RepID=A0ABR7YIA4_9SPHI|nr:MULTISPECIES: formyltetrahydrofolate deformylase [Sphingobacterium]MBD1431042.1 formyltetrahydrofolate deformylase [Sphingobacterium litopenaei]NGM73695.1 formyltetrahydrofolate deformylase [Sphingobacterium sp. SGL-16]
MTKQTLILIQCQDAVGLVSNISNVLAKHKLNIITMREYVDEENNKFFVRVVCTGYVEESNGLYSHLKAVLPEKASISINPSKRKRIAVLVTKEHHCLADILVRNYFDTLNADVCAVIGNYDNLRDFAERFDIPYYHISHENKTKEDFEGELAVQLKALNPDFIVLAKFMRILSPSFVKEFEHRIINIHHSFLPAFIGANPYKQAHDRGVKIIGATAHFVTNDLDEGPIIVQNIKNIDHSYDVHKMKRTGQEIEKAVLTRAIQLIVEDRVMLNGNKTIVFKA